MNTSSVELKNIWFSYPQSGRDEYALRDVSFSVPTGSITTLLGPNGSGKTTLLKLLLGLLKPSKGSIDILGGVPGQKHSRIGYVPQRFSFEDFFPMQVEELMYFSNPHLSTELLSHFLEELSLQNERKTTLGELSGGQLQRVLIARALVGEPDIIFLDEPVSGIDVGGEKNFYELIKSLHQLHKITIVMVSHEVDVVQNFSTQVICLNNAEMICAGTPQKVLTSEVLKRLYGSSGTVYEHNHTHHA